ncbi:hypothetical protein MD484_g1941, partial [Candolleomyces efflorescens]
MGLTRALAYLSLALSLSATANAYWLMGLGDAITKERIDPIVNPGEVSGHTHIVFGGSNFGFSVTTQKLVESECTSVPIAEDKSNYWAPLLYFQWANGSFTSVDGGAVAYYLFPDKPGTTTAFPPDFRMLSGSPRKRTYDPNDYAQQAIDFLCLDFNGQTTKHTSLPPKVCPSGIRSQVNFPSCWDGKNLDSPDHKSHVAFRSGGPDKGDCTDPKYPVSIPRIFLEIYWNTGTFDKVRDQAKNPNQPFVFAYGDETGYGNHADFYNGWESGVLQRAVDGCNCNIYGDPTCCGQEGKNLFTIRKDNHCRITPAIDERTTGTLPKLPGNNPVQPAGKDAQMFRDSVIPALISPVYAYTGNAPTKTGTVVGRPSTVAGGTAPTTVPTSVVPPSPGTTTVDSSPGVVPPATTSPSGNQATTGAPPATTGPSNPVTTGASPATTSPSGNPVTTGGSPATTGPSGNPVTTGAPPATTGPTTGRPITTGVQPSSRPVAVVTPPAQRPPTTTPGIPKPSTTKICRPKKKHPSSYHGKPGRNFFHNHQKRYDFDVDDYYHA